jgi:hypothetical protein
MNHNYPDLNIRYAGGLGDIIASILHSKPLGWIVKSITKQDKPCNSCSQRRYALNFLVPIKIWKLFFKNEDAYLENLKDFYIKCGFNATLDYENKVLSATKFEEFPVEPTFMESIDEIKQHKTPNKEGYLFLSSNEVALDDHLIRTEYFKKL